MTQNRPYFRMEFDGDLDVTIETRHQKKRRGVVKDISASGIAFYMAVPLESGDHVVTFVLEERIFQFPVVVIRTFEATENQFLIGCQFKEGNPIKIGELCTVLLRIDTKRRKDTFDKRK